MSQDIIADTLNMMNNVKRAGKTELIVKHHSKFLISVLAIAKLKGYVKSYKVDGTDLHIELGKLNSCKAIKPRFMVSADMIDRYMKRYLPAKNIGIIVISTSKGLMTHTTTLEKNIRESLIAYLY